MMPVKKKYQGEGILLKFMLGIKFSVELMCTIWPMRLKFPGVTDMMVSECRENKENVI